METAIHCAALMEESETRLIARGLRLRDPELMDALIERYQHRLFRFLLFLTRNRAWAEDLFQETWLRVVERGSQYDARWRFQSWLLAIARNLAIDQARRRQPLSLEDSASAAEGESGISLLDRLPSSDPDPFQQAAGRDEQDRLADVLGHLPTHYREVLTMRFHEELQLDEIAHVTGAPLSTVKSRLRRGLELVRERLQRRGHESGQV